MVKLSSSLWLAATLICTFAVLASTPSYAKENAAIAKTTDTHTQQNTADKKDDQNKKICKRVKVTGTHFRKRICSTKAGWRELEMRSQDTVRELTRGRPSSN